MLAEDLQHLPILATDTAMGLDRWSLRLLLPQHSADFVLNDWPLQNLCRRRCCSCLAVLVDGIDSANSHNGLSSINRVTTVSAV